MLEICVYVCVYGNKYMGKNIYGNKEENRVVQGIQRHSNLKIGCSGHLGGSIN